MSVGTFFKTFSNSDRTTTRTLLHESIPITGTLAKGTYNSSAQSDGISREQNVKTFSHAMFQSVYDYPHLSSSANHIFDITAGFSAASSVSSSAHTHVNVLGAKKINMYNQMAQALVGYDTSNLIRRFDQDGDLSSGTKHDEVVFLNFSRLLVKDEIKKGSFSLELGGNPDDTNPFNGNRIITISDSNAATNTKVNSPAGEYGILISGSTNVGLIYYQAGIAVLGKDAFKDGASDTLDMTPSGSLVNSMASSSINQIADAVRNRIHNVSFSNTTELNSSIYFCRASHNEFNYSSNPTYLSGSKIIVKDDDIETPPRSYITTVGLYSADNELMAVAKLSEPLKKTPDNEVTLRVRLDY